MRTMKAAVACLVLLNSGVWSQPPTPKNVGVPTTVTDETTLPEEQRFLVSLLELINGQGDLTIFFNSLSGFTPALANRLFNRDDGLDTFTVFAPVDFAWRGVDTKFFSAPYAPHLEYLLQFHVASGSLLISDLATTDAVPSLLDGLRGVKADTYGLDGMMVKGRYFSSNLTETDLVASNGILHKVDTVFVPALLSQTLLEVAESLDGFTVMSNLLVSVELEKEVTAPDRTIFAPTQDAFLRAPQELTNLIQTDSSLLKAILLHHIVEGVHPEARLIDGMSLTTRGKHTLLVQAVRQGPFQEITVDGVSIFFADSVASNGIAHVVNSLLLPPEAEQVLNAENTSNISETLEPPSGGEPNKDDGSDTSVSVHDGVEADMNDATSVDAEHGNSSSGESSVTPPESIEDEDPSGNDNGLTPTSAGNGCTNLSGYLLLLYVLWLDSLWPLGR